MSVRVFGSRAIHRARRDQWLPDRRLGVTICGIVFAWGVLPAGDAALPPCEDCR